MTALRIHRELVAGAVMLKLYGTFDNCTAAELRRSLDQLGTAEVVLDFSGVDAFSDSAVAVLSRGIKRAVTIRGLGRHQERIFAYLGFLPPASRTRIYDPAEELLAS